MEPKRTHVLSYYGVAMPPHTVKERLKLSNTTDRVYRVVHLFLFYERASEATTPGVVEMRVDFTESGGTNAGIAVLRYTGNTVYQRGSYSLPYPITIWKGDSLRVYTSDSSTGGTVTYRVGLVCEVI